MQGDRKTAATANAHPSDRLVDIGSNGVGDSTTAIRSNSTSRSSQRVGVAVVRQSHEDLQGDETFREQLLVGVDPDVIHEHTLRKGRRWIRAIRNVAPDGEIQYQEEGMVVDP